MKCLVWVEADEKKNSSTTFKEVSCGLSCAQILPNSDWELVTRALVQCSVAPSAKASTDTSLHSKVATDQRDNCRSEVQLHQIQLPNGTCPNLTRNRASEWCTSSCSSSEGTGSQEVKSPAPAQCPCVPMLIQRHSW